MRYEVHVQRAWDADLIEFFLIERAGEKSFYIESQGGDVYRRTIAEEGMKVKPFMTFRGRDSDMVRAFGDAINTFLGRPDETFTRGNLEATERHLEDMRAIALKPRTR